MRAWYSGIFGGLLPILLLGFLYSAIADRTIFALWALAVGVLWIWTLRDGIVRGRPLAQRISHLAITLSLGLNWFGSLEEHNHEILDLGFRAMFPSVYRPAATNPNVAYSLGIALIVVSLVFLIVWRRGRKASPPSEDNHESQA